MATSWTVRGWYPGGGAIIRTCPDRPWVTPSLLYNGYRPWQALRVPGGRGSQILRQSLHEDSNVVSPTHRPSLPPGNILGTHLRKRLSRPEEHGATGNYVNEKNSVTPWGIEPAAFRFVQQCLKHWTTACPLRNKCSQNNVPNLWQMIHRSDRYFLKN
jgi:hypothetical protein